MFMQLFIYCAGGFGFEVIDLAKRINKVKKIWERIYFIDDMASENERYGVLMFPLERVIKEFNPGSYEVSIANGEPFERKNILLKLRSNNIHLATLIDPSAIISETAVLSEGVVVPPFCFISSNAKMGSNCTLNVASLIGHDVTIRENCVISSAVNIGGNCTVGENTYIGMGSQIKQGVKIGSGVIIGMGSVVYNDIPDGVIALGNPARPMKNNDNEKVFKK
jgi:sugar O-acyltransferase (sialic acid O-acetyltransferase NeuD family)